MSSSLGASKHGCRGSGSTRGLDARKLQRKTVHGDVAFQGSPVERPRENDVRGRSLDRNVDGEAELVLAQVSADDRGGATLAGNGAGDRSVLIHRQVRGGFIGTVVGRGVGKLPSPADVPFRRIFGLLRPADFKSAAVHKNHFDLRFFLKEVAVSNDKV